MNDHDNLQDLWRRNDPGLPQPPTTAEICALARRRVQEDLWFRRIGVLVLAGSAIGYAYNTWKIEQSWVRLGQGWMLIVLTLFLFGLLLDRTSQRASNETCEGFLLRSLQRKRDGYLALRRVVLLFIPGIAATWWGGGLAMRLDPSSPYFRYLTGNWPMITVCFLLLLVWLAFSVSAKKAFAELEALRQRIGAAPQ
jgi:hypothetical protein